MRQSKNREDEEQCIFDDVDKLLEKQQTLKYSIFGTTMTLRICKLEGFGQ